MSEVSEKQKNHYTCSRQQKHGSMLPSGESVVMKQRGCDLGCAREDWDRRRRPAAVSLLYGCKHMKRHSQAKRTSAREQLAVSSPEPLLRALQALRCFQMSLSFNAASYHTAGRRKPGAQAEKSTHLITKFSLVQG